MDWLGRAPSLRDLFPVAGIITAVIATIGGVLTTILGPVKKLRLPVEAQSVRGHNKGLLNVVPFAPFVICFVFMRREWAPWALVGALLPLILAVLYYQNFGGLLDAHRYVKPRARRFLWWQWNREEYIIGGTVLKPDAVAYKARTGATDAEALKAAEYNPDEIWERDDRIRIRKKIERYYYGFMLCALLTVVLAALALQTVLSGEDPVTSAQQVWAELAARKR